MSEYDWPKPGDVLSRVSYAGLCPEGHEAVWTATYTQQKESTPKTEATFECAECEAEEAAA